jgi:hypothetical protein
VSLSTLQLDKARHLLTLINPQHLRKVYSHRAARIILMKQEKILHRMVTEGTRTPSAAVLCPLL